jgi:hypothetical protein
MPDYASILKRSVSALPDPSPEMREAVYQRARAALARQLTAVDPPLSTREIETQHQELEDAVERLESEFNHAQEPEPLFSGSSQRDEFLYSAPQTATAQPKPAPVPEPPIDLDDGAADYDDDADDDFSEDEEQSSRVPLLIGVVLVLLVIVGAGAFAFAQRGTILGLLGFGDEQGEVASVDTNPAPAPAGPEIDPDKRDDRLTNGGEGGAPDMAAAPAVPPAEPDAVIVPESEAPAGEQTATLEEPDTSLVGQKAIYYYQGAPGTDGEASEGTVTWTEVTKDDRPAIQATLKIAKPNVTAIVTIYKNFDTALPASHLVEIQFSGGLSANPIQRVPALVLKQTEQARGQPLAGAAVPVTNDLFWIALSDDAEQVTRNLQLLREGSWFDIPILFSDQTRALISFEKGIPGDKVFETVMGTWTPT